MFDKSMDEMREDLVSLHGNDVYDWDDEVLIEEYNTLYDDSVGLTEGDFSNIDAMDNEFDNRWGLSGKEGYNYDDE
mgnify:FL=1|tara:strand:+ start:219 stop:446 length:228 start_codon:yes stop_codon:yes gene_type:complete